MITIIVTDARRAEAAGAPALKYTYKYIYIYIYIARTVWYPIPSGEKARKYTFEWCVIEIAEGAFPGAALGWFSMRGG